MPADTWAARLRPQHEVFCPGCGAKCGSASSHVSAQDIASRFYCGNCGRFPLAVRALVETKGDER